MSQHIYLWASLSDPNDVHIVHRPDDKEGTASNNAILMLNGQDSRFMRATLPPTNEGRMRTAAAFAVEDDIATSIDDSHIALGVYNDGVQSLELLDKSAFAKLITVLSQQGYEITAAYSDLHLLPRNENGKIISMPDGVERALLRNDEGGLIAMEADIAKDLFDEDSFAGTFSEKAVPYTSALADFRALEKNTAIDLLQASFKPRMRLGDIWLIWRPTGLMMAAALALLLVAAIATPLSLSRQAEALDKEADALISNHFPGVRSLPHLRQRLRQLEGDSADAFLTLTSITFAAVSDVEGIAISSIRYDDNREGLALAIEAGSYEAIQALSSALEARGGIMVEGASRQNGTLVISDLVITRRN